MPHQLLHVWEKNKTLPTLHVRKMKTTQHTHLPHRSDTARLCASNELLAHAQISTDIQAKLRDLSGFAWASLTHQNQHLMLAHQLQKGFLLFPYGQIFSGFQNFQILCRERATSISKNAKQDGKSKQRPTKYLQLMMPLKKRILFIHCIFLNMVRWQ